LLHPEPIPDALHGMMPRAPARCGVGLFRLAVERSFAMLSQAKRDVQLSRLRWLIAVENCRNVLRRLDRQRKYDPNQPRVPAGNADGGQWTDSNGNMSDIQPPTDISAAGRKQSEAYCWNQLQIDTLLCNSVFPAVRRGACRAQAMERYSACLAGRAMPPLSY